MKEAYVALQKRLDNEVYTVDKFLINQFGIRDISSKYTKNKRNNNMSNLILHCGSKKIERDDLQMIHTPAPTKSWKPVPHFDVTEIIRDEAKIRGFEIEKEDYGLNLTGTKMFGVLRFYPNGHPEHTRALGIRNSHDKAFALGLTVGISVLVCDNLCFGGEKTIKRKHTSGIEITDLIPQAFENIEEQYKRLESNVDDLKLQMITMDNAKVIIVEAAKKKVIPSCDIIPVLNEFENPQHEEFEETSRWSLYNAFTEVAKKYSPNKADNCYKRLSNIFDLT